MKRLHSHHLINFNANQINSGRIVSPSDNISFIYYLLLDKIKEKKHVNIKIKIRIFFKVFLGSLVVIFWLHCVLTAAVLWQKSLKFHEIFQFPLILHVVKQSFMIV